MSSMAPRTIPAPTPATCFPCLPGAAFCRPGVALVDVGASVCCGSAGTYVVAVTITTPPVGFVLVNVDVTGLTDGIEDGLPVGFSVIMVVAESLLVSEQPILHYARECTCLKEEGRRKREENKWVNSYVPPCGREVKPEREVLANPVGDVPCLEEVKEGAEVE
jgi:hypothetical protein